MAKVEMSLAEYDSMKSELEFYKEAVDLLFALPNISSWEVDQYKNNGSSIYLSAKVPFEHINHTNPDISEFFKSRILSFVDSFTKDAGITDAVLEVDNISLNLGVLRKKDESDGD